MRVDTLDQVCRDSAGSSRQTRAEQTVDQHIGVPWQFAAVSDRDRSARFEPGGTCQSRITVRFVTQRDNADIEPRQGCEPGDEECIPAIVAIAR